MVCRSLTAVMLVLATEHPDQVAGHLAPPSPSSIGGEVMVQVKALSSFEHNGRRERNAKFDVSPQHAELLVKRGLVTAVAGGGADSAGKSGANGGGAALVDQNAASTVAAIAKVSDPIVLSDALLIEQAKGEKARKTVVEALTAAIAAAQAQA